MPNRFTLRWWHWLLLAVIFCLLLILTVVLALRSIGRSEYQAVIRDLRARQQVATVDDYIAQAPPVDAPVQAAWKRWSDVGLEFPGYSRQTLSPEQWQAYVLGTAQVPADFLAELEHARSTVDTVRAILRTHRLILSAKGWAAQDMPKDHRTPADFAKLTIPNLLTTRSLANWLRYESCLSPDPGPVLDDLDAYHRALAQPGCLMDAIISIVISGLRDEAYLDLALMGRLPNGHLDRWLAEPCTLINGVADGFDGERTMFSGWWTEWVEDMGLLQSFHQARVMSDLSAGLSGTSTPWWNPEWLYSGPWLWCTAHHDMAILAQAEADVSTRLRGETTAMPDAQATVERLWGYGGVSLPNLMESAITGLEAEARHRMIRVAVRILTRAPDIRLPTDQDGLIQFLGGTKLLSPTGDHLHLAYERLADDRFRLIVSPTSPVPNFDAPGRLTGRTRAFGTPASPKPLVTRSYVELPLPARLRQGPP